MRRFLFSAVFVCSALGVFAASAVAETWPYDHIHLNVPDPAAASAWYVKYFGAKPNHEGPDRLMLGSTRRNPGARASHTTTTASAALTRNASRRSTASTGTG